MAPKPANRERLQGVAPKMNEDPQGQPRMLQFLPWCSGEGASDLGALELVPHRVGAKGPFSCEEDAATVDGILRSFVGVSCPPKGDEENVAELFPVREVLIARWKDRDPLHVLDDGEVELSRELVDLFAFACAANRDYFIGPPWHYCNRDVFTFYVHRFTRRHGATTFTARRVDGHHDQIIAHPRITAPLHINPCVGRKANPDEALLAALLEAREAIEGEWERWIDAIRSFLAANTDSDAISIHQELVFACGAFQRFLDSSEDREVAKRFARIMCPENEITVGDVRRLAAIPGAPQQLSVREFWMLELQRVRHAPAHGAGRVSKPSPWLPREHLFLTAIAFPLAVKAALISRDLYSASSDDVDHASALEPLAAVEDFFRPMDGDRFWWHRVLNDLKHERLMARMLGKPGGDANEEGAQEAR
jgi:hypothetical protein